MKGKDIAAIAALWMLILAVYVPVLARDRVMVDDPALIDVSFNIMPTVYWMAESWKRGEFPLWNPHTVCGMPHLGYSHAMGLYPVAVALFTRFSYIIAHSLEIIIHSLFAASFFFILLRRYGIDRVVSAATGLVLVLSGFFLGSLYDMWMKGSFCWLLLFWICMKELLARARLKWFIGACLAVAWTGFAGDEELLSYGLMLLGLLFFLESGFKVKRFGRLSLWYTAAVTAGFLIFSPLALSTMETVYFSIRGPLIPFPMKVISSGLPWETYLPAMFFPFTYFRELGPISALNSGLSPLYQGFLVVGLVLWGLVLAGRNKELRPAAISWAGLFLFMTAREGEATGRIIDLIPVIKSLRFTGKALMVLHPLALLLSAQVLSGVASGRAATGLGPRVLGLVLMVSGAAMLAAQPWCLGGPERYVIGAAAVAAGLAAMMYRNSKPLLTPRAVVYAAAGLLTIEVMALGFRFVPRTDPARFELDSRLERLAHTLAPQSRFAVFEQLLSEDPKATEPPIFGTVEVASGAGNLVGPSRVQPARIFLFLSRFYTKLMYNGPDGGKIFTGWSMTNPGSLDRGRMHLFNLAGPVTIFDRGLCLPYSSPYSLMRPGAVAWKFSGAGIGPGDTSGEALIKGPARMTAAFATYAGDLLTVSAEAQARGTGWMLALARPGEGQAPRILVARFMAPENGVTLKADMDALQGGGDMDLAWVPWGDRESGLVVRDLSILNSSRPFQELNTFGDVTIYLNNAALPRAFVARSPKVVPGMAAEMDYISDPSRFSPLNDVVLSEDSSEIGIVEKGGEARFNLQGPDQAMITEYGPERVKMTARLAAPGFLVFTDTYFAGWRAMVKSEGRRWEARIMPADVAFRAVFLPEGESMVTWTYRPVPFRIGLWCGVSSLLIALLCFFLAPRQQKAGAFLEATGQQGEEFRDWKSREPRTSR